MPSQVPLTQLARGRKLAAQHLRVLLSENETYRDRWICLAGKTPPGEISQAAVARVIVDHLRKAGDEAVRLDYRLLKDRVYRALSGRALTRSTLALFAAAFPFSDEDTRYLWALFLGTTPDGARAAFRPPNYHVASLSMIHEVNSEGRPRSRRVRQRITANEDGVSRVPLRFDSSDVAVKISDGDISDTYRCADDLFAVDVLLPKVLNKNESFNLEYVVEYPADANADPEFLRGAIGQYIDSATIEVKFSRANPPSTVWWTVLSNLGSGGRTVLREQVEIDHKKSSVSKTVSSVDDVVIGFRWEY